MPKFTFIAEHDDGTTTTTEFNKDFIYDVIENFEMFLRGVGFVFHGNIDITEEITGTTATDDHNDDWPFSNETEITLDYGAAQPAVYSPIQDEITITLNPEVNK